MMQKKEPKLFFQNKLALVILIALGSASWLLTVIKSGLIYSFGMGFWGPNGHDGIWHIALAESLAKGSLAMPTFAGSDLQNYHIGFDLLLAFLHNFTKIPIHNLYFQILPIFIAIAVGVLTYRFVAVWTRSSSQALWAVFFVYFGGGFGWLVTLLRSGKFGGESLFWSQQAVSTLINPPFALSLVIILIGLILLLNTKRTLTRAILIILCFGILIQVKAYAAAICLGGLLVASVFELIKRQDKWYLSIFLGSSVIAIILLILISGLNSSILVWQPFWLLELMMGAPDRFNWPKYYEAMINYRAGNSIKFFPAYALAFAIFWFGNIGTRVIKEWQIVSWIRNYKKIGFWEVFFSTCILTGILMSMLFLQKGTPWNTIQFLYYSLFFSSILAGISTAKFLQKHSQVVRLLVATLLVLLTIPTSLSTLVYHYLPVRPPAKISLAELEALNFLAAQPTGVVLTFPFDKTKADGALPYPPRPLYLYESTAYVAAFSKMPLYLEDQVNLDITGFDWQSRREEVLEFYHSRDGNFAAEFLRQNNIAYIYWLKGQRATLSETELRIDKLFENSEVNIYKVQ